MTDPTRRTILGAGLLAGAGVLSACGGPPTSECLQGEHQLEGGPVDVFPFIAPERPRLKRQVPPQSLTVSPDGKRVAAYEPWDRRLLEESETAGTTVWDTVTDEILARLNDGMTDAIAWHPHDDRLATAASSVVRISRSDGEVLWTLSGHRVNTRWRTFDIKDLAFHPDGHQLASLSTDGTVRVWSLDGGTCTPSPVLRVRSGRPSSLAYTEDGSRIAVAVGAPGELGRTAWGPDGTLYAVARWWGVIPWDGQGWRPFELP